jgi:hypothetical protein
MRRNALVDVVLAELRKRGIQEATVENGGKHVLVRWNARGRTRTTAISHSGSRNWRTPHYLRTGVRRMLREDLDATP